MCCEFVHDGRTMYQADRIALYFHGGKQWLRSDPRGLVMPQGIRADMTGQRFDCLVAVRCLGRVGRRTVWEFLCDCGKLTNRTRDEIIQATKRGGHISCGCRKNEFIGLGTSSHRLSKSKEHRAWCGMKTRCLNTRDGSYARYGGRGIRIHQPWIGSFEEFYAYVGPAPSPRHSIDRIDNNGHYEPGNVRWATHEEQSRNRRTNVTVELDGSKMLLIDAMRELDVSAGFIKRRAGILESLRAVKSASSGRTPYRGVHRRKSGRFSAVLWDGVKLVQVGTFDSPEEAHVHWMAAKVSLDG